MTELPDREFPTRVLLRFSAGSRAGRIDSLGNRRTVENGEGLCDGSNRIIHLHTSPQESLSVTEHAVYRPRSFVVAVMVVSLLWSVLEALAQAPDLKVASIEIRGAKLS